MVRRDGSVYDGQNVHKPAPKHDGTAKHDGSIGHGQEPAKAPATHSGTVRHDGTADRTGKAK